MAIDPVCGMEIQEETAAATTTYQGTVYYFCAVGCKNAFEEDPEKYLAKNDDHDTSHGHH